jgi:hypothetical protein
MQDRYNEIYAVGKELGYKAMTALDQMLVDTMDKSGLTDDNDRDAFTEGFWNGII